MQEQQYEAGRELDELIAEKIMGDKQNNVDWYWWNGTNLDKAAGVYAGPFFSTDIAAAWQVVEKLFSKCDLSCKVVFIQDGQVGIKFFTSLAGDNIWTVEREVLSTVVADTLPFAICLAALKAVS